MEMTYITNFSNSIWNVSLWHFYTYRSLYFVNIYSHYLPPSNLLLSTAPLPLLHIFPFMHIYALSYVYIYDLDLNIFKSRLQLHEKDVIFYLSILHVPSLVSILFLPQSPRGFYIHVKSTYKRRCSVYLSESGLRWLSSWFPVLLRPAPSTPTTHHGAI